MGNRLAINGFVEHHIATVNINGGSGKRTFSLLVWKYYTHLIMAVTNINEY